MDRSLLDALALAVVKKQARRTVISATVISLATSLGLHLAPDRALGKKRRKKKKKPARPAAPPPPTCSDPFSPHWCASAQTCVPTCPTGTRYDPASCSCVCIFEAACLCFGGANPFCRNTTGTEAECIAACAQDDPGYTSHYFCGGPQSAWTCRDQPGSCNRDCRDDPCGTKDACLGNTDPCGFDNINPVGRCYRPLGGGPSRCGVPTVTSSCGCVSHQQCADNHGPGSLCVQITGGACTCGGGYTTFCTTPVSVRP